MAQGSPFRVYLDEFRELVEPEAWSDAVRASRSADINIRKEGTKAYIVVRLGTEKKATMLEFGLHEEQYVSDCSCGDDPCVHLVSAVILANAKWSDLDLQDEISTYEGGGAIMEYHLSFEGSFLYVTRVLKEGDSEKKFSESLVEYVGGVSSGRINASMPMVGADDYMVDRALGLRKQTLVEASLLREAFVALSRLSQVFYKGKRIQVSRDPISYEIQFEKTKEGYRSIPRKVASESIFVEEETLFWRNKPDPETAGYLASETLIRKEEVPFFVETVLPLLRKHGVMLTGPSEGWPEVREVPVSVVFEIHAIDSGFAVMPCIEYGSPAIARVENDRCVLLDDAVFPKRNIEKERALVAEVYRDTSLRVGRQKVVSDEEAVLLAEKVRTKNRRGDSLDQFLPLGSLVPSIHPEGSGLSVQFSLSTVEGNETISFDTVLEAYTKGETRIQMPAGGWAKLPQGWLQEIMPFVGSSGFSDGGSRKSRSSTLQALTLSSFLGEEGKEAVASFYERVYSLEKSGSAYVLPEDITLREYQKEGVQWIQGLSAIEDSGALLADDMGLGKTIQTLCAIRFPALIIVPTSLLPQWEEEIGKFYPGINLCVYHGSGRVWSDDSDVTLSTYGLLRNDTGCFQSRNFSMTVLDEVQTIKNPESGVSEAAFSLCSDFRLALTGTPVENSLRDLWSIFNYILPGILPEPEALDALAMKEGGIELIRKLIHPFIKRRRKEDVLTELPEKTEITIPCVMDTMQRESYEKILFEAKSEAKDYLDKKKGFMSLFEKLLRLRQVCVHPSLSGLDSNIPSVKLEVLMDLLDQACKGGHKVLLFSQWTSALDIIEPLITKEISRPLRLDGSTRNRAPIIEQFKTDPSSQIFLLSLKAGGVGLNLTEADHVYFLDSWWNPAVEKQAADRVYRMGQDKPVFIYRLVVKDTIEEKILALHERKSALSNSLLEGSLDQSGRVTEEDIRFLLSL